MSLFRLMFMRHQSSELTRRARAMRREPSAAENKLWQLVRGRQLEGFKFVRQEPLGPFIADFVCRSRKLIVEVDGNTHEGEAAQNYDAQRTAYLTSLGYRVLRVPNEAVLGDAGDMLEEIVKCLREMPSSSP
jgi:very-short-patch-repair endonuclease